MPSDSEALIAGAGNLASDNALTLAAFEPEGSEPTEDLTPAATGNEVLELFPRESPDGSDISSIDTRTTPVAIPAPAALRQTRVPLVARLGGLALVGAAIGLWSSLQWLDAPRRTAGDVTAVADEAPAPALPQQTALPTVVSQPTVVSAGEQVQPQNVAAQPAVITSAAERSDSEAGDQALQTRQTTSRRPVEDSIRTTRATEPVTRLRPAPPAAAEAARPATPPSVVAEVARTARIPVDRPEPRTPATPIDPLAPAVAPDAPTNAPASAPATSAPEIAGTSAPAPTPAPATAPVRDMADIQGVLTRYASAFSNLNPVAVHDVWPTVDSRALTRAFRGLEEQEIAFANCDIKATGTSAAASCGGTLRYVTRIGSKDPRTESRRWQFRMRKTGGRWVIENVESW